MTSVSLGNFFSSNGRTVLGGLGGSGLDTESLIKTLTDAKAAPKLKLEDKVKLNDNKLTAYGELRTIMAGLKDAANFLRNPPGVGNDADNVFKYRTASATSNTSVSADTYLSVAAEPGTAEQSYNISQITSLAHAKKQITGSFAVADTNTSVVTSAATAGFFKAGSVAVNGQTLTLSAGDSLATVVSKFNAISDDTGITASIIQAGTNDYRLVFTANEAGTASDFDLNIPSAAVPADADGVFSMISRTNLLSNGTFDSGIGSWTNASVGTGTISHNGIDSAMTLDGDGAANEAFAQQAITTVIGQQYTVRATLSDLTSSAFIRVGSSADVTTAANSDVSDYEVLADGSVSFTFTATSTTSYLTINSGSNTGPINVDDISVVSNATPTVTTTQAASDAEFVIDGVTVTRDSNTITDVIDGVTFNLVSTTPALTELQVDITDDTSLPKNGVINFINAFNALRIFAAKQSQVSSDGTYADESYLATDALLKNTLSSLSSELSRIVSGAGSYTSLSDIGITYADLPESNDNPQTRNVLTVNEEKLATALSANFSSVENLFGFSFTSTNPNLAIYSRTNALNADTFSVTVNPGTSYQAVVDGVTYDLTATSLGTSGYTLTGKAGTPLEGLVMIYGSTSAGTADVTVTQGIADRIYNLASNMLDAQTGTLVHEEDAVKTSTTRYEDEMARIDDQVAKYRDTLLQRFGALETVLSSVNTLLSSLDAQQQARNNASS